MRTGQTSHRKKAGKAQAMARAASLVKATSVTIQTGGSLTGHIDRLVTETSQPQMVQVRMRRSESGGLRVEGGQARGTPTGAHKPAISSASKKKQQDSQPNSGKVIDYAKKPSFSKQASVLSMRQLSPQKQAPSGAKSQHTLSKKATNLKTGGNLRSGSQKTLLFPAEGRRVPGAAVRHSSLSPMKEPGEKPAPSMQGLQLVALDAATPGHQALNAHQRRIAGQSYNGRPPGYGLQGLHAAALRQQPEIHEASGYQTPANDQLGQIKVKLPYSKGHILPAEPPVGKLSGVAKATQEKANRTIQQLQQSDLWPTSGSPAGTAAGKRFSAKRLDSDGYSYLRTGKDRRVLNDDSTTGRSGALHSAHALLENSDSDSRALEEDRAAGVTSEVLMLPKLNKQILPKPRNLRNFQSHHPDNLGSEPSTMSMYGGPQGTPMSYSTVNSKADKLRASNSSLVHQYYRNQGPPSEYSAPEGQPALLIRPNDLHLKRSSLQQSEPKGGKKRNIRLHDSTDEFSLNRSVKTTPLKQAPAHSLIQSSHSKSHVSQMQQYLVDDNGPVMFLPEKEAGLQQALREPTQIHQKYFKHFEAITQSQEKALVKARASQKTLAVKELGIDHKKALHTIHATSSYALANPSGIPFKTPYKLNISSMSGSGVLANASFVSGSEDEHQPMQKQGTKYLAQSSHSLQSGHYQLVPALESTPQSRNGPVMRQVSKSPLVLRKASDIREAAQAALGLHEARDHRPPGYLERDAAKEEAESGSSFFPFIERQKRDCSTSLGIADRGMKIETLESEQDESPLPYGRARSKSKSNNFGKKTSMQVAGHAQSQNELPANSFGAMAARADPQGQGLAALPGHELRRPSDLGAPRCAISLESLKQAPTRVAGPGNVPFLQVNQAPPQNSADPRAPPDKSYPANVLFEQLSTEKLVTLIQEQQHKYPELNALSADQLQQLLLQHMIKVKEGRGGPQNPAGTGEGGSSREATEVLNAAARASQPFQNRAIAEMVSYSPPTQIINHYNITINHQSVPNDLGEAESSFAGVDQQKGRSGQEGLNGPGQQNSAVSQLTSHYALKAELSQKGLEKQQRELQIAGSNGAGVLNPQSMFTIKHPRIKKKAAFDPNIRLGRQLLRSLQQSGNAPASVDHTRVVENLAAFQAAAGNPAGEQQKPPVIPGQLAKINQLSKQPDAAGSNSGLTTPSAPSALRVNQEAASPTPAGAGSVKSGLTGTAIKREVVAPKRLSLILPKVDLSSVTVPDCALIDTTNRPCQQMRAKVEEEKDWLTPDRLDMIVITFDGVLGTFLSHETLQGALSQPLLKPEGAPKTDTLFLRPGLSKALCDLLPHFKIGILVTERSTLRHKCIIKTLRRHNVPYDAMYATLPSFEDNFYTYHSIRRDSEVGNLQIMFLTAQKFMNNAPRGQIDKTTKKSNPESDYSALPVALDMERLIIFCVPHLLAEAKLDNLCEPLDSLDRVLVCDLVAASQTIVNFFNISRTFSENELIRETQLEKKKFVKDKPGKANPRPATNSAAKKVEDKSRAPGNLTGPKTMKKQPTEVLPTTASPQLSIFQLLTSINEQTAESLYPISFFQERVFSLRGRNTFFKAFSKAQRYELFSLNYYQLTHFSTLILGQRLHGSMHRIQLKLAKIKQAMRKAQRDLAVDPEEKTFRINRDRYEIQRRQPAFASYRMYNMHYFSEIYDECQVRLPCHPSKDQFDKLTTIYKQLQSRLDNLVNNTFTFSEVQEPEKGLENSYYNLMMFKSHLFQQSPIVHAAECPRRGYVLKEQYAQSLQKVPQSAAKPEDGAQARDQLPSQQSDQITQEASPEFKLQVTPTNLVEAVTNQESTAPPVRRVQQEVPDLVAWMSIRQHQQSGTQAAGRAAGESPDIPRDSAPSVKPATATNQASLEPGKPSAKAALDNLVSELDTINN